METTEILAQERERASAKPAQASTRNPLAAWDVTGEPVVVEGGHGVAFFARRASTGVMHACYQRGTDGTGKVVGIPVLAVPSLGFVPAPPEPEQKPASKSTQKKGASK